MWPSSQASRTSEQRNSSSPPECARSRKPSRTRCGTPRSASSRRRIASGAIPIPPPTRIAPAAPGASSARAENGRPSGPGERAASPPRSSPASRSVPGPTASSRKSSRTPSWPASASATENARGRYGRPAGAAPAVARRACRTGRRAGSGPSASSARDDPVAAGRLVRDHLAARGGRTAPGPASSAMRLGRAMQLLRARPAPRSRSRAATIARAAAEAPVIVVMQGIPLATAAVRIS